VRRRWVVGIVVIAAFLGSCNQTPVETTTVTVKPNVTSTVPPSTAATAISTTSSSAAADSDLPLDSGDVAGFRLDMVHVGGEPMLVAVADTSDLRQRGLMGVTDLGDLDGMLFEWDELVTGSFWMKDTLIPLDIVFFDADGKPVGSASMTPCLEAPCARYGADGAYLWALETPVGVLPDPSGVTLLR